MSSFIQNNQEIISVSDVNNLAKGLLEKDLSNVWIQGEISSFTAHGSGHWYFTIKDKKSALDCVMFKFDNINLLFEPKVGDELILNGNVSIYSPTGRYQFNVKHIEVSGEGALLRAFEELKKKLELEGLFDETRKKVLPEFPMEISVITSATGAVIKDIINVLSRRSPNMTLTLVEAQVQGKQAEKSICNAIERVNYFRQSDLIILARGGGSIEDLWCFNMESVARSIFNSEIPLISAVGHETDFTISDFVSDLRAPTPSAAAEIISQNHSNLFASLTSMQKDLSLSINNELVKQNESIKNLSKLIKHPGDKLREISQKIDGLEMHLSNLTERIFLISRNKISTFSSSLKEFSPIVRVEKNKNRIESSIKDIKRSIEEVIGEKRNLFLSSSKTLEAVSPLSVLSRGYSILTKGEKEQVINSYAQVKIGDEIKGKLKEGQILTKVIEVSDEN
jgi:exodeoxyribonuclease VII large subunit